MSTTAEGWKKKQRHERPFVFENYPSRKIALRLAYHGHLYDGLMKQSETSNTVEAYVVEALKHVRLVSQNGPTDLSRCGRTDKGVSALGNAFSLTVRASSLPTDTPQKPPLDYCVMLNQALPVAIRVVGWAYVDDTFDARFSCVGRTYRYYFCHRGLNVEAMRMAAAQLKGVHNFRNFCKMDVVNVNNYERHVYNVGIFPSETVPELVSYFEIHANSFLYHQIRCTMEVLFLVGRGLEEPDVVTRLLERGDRKPVYPLADPTPLVLWECHFEDVRWNISQRALLAAECELQDIATALMLRMAVATSMRSQLFAWYDGGVGVGGEGAAQRTHEADRWSVSGCDWTDERTHMDLRARKSNLLELSKRTAGGAEEISTGRSYVKLLERETERTFDEEVQALSEKKRARFECNMKKKAKNVTS